MEQTTMNINVCDLITLYLQSQSCQQRWLQSRLSMMISTTRSLTNMLCIHTLRIFSSDIGNDKHQHSTEYSRYCTRRWLYRVCNGRISSKIGKVVAQQTPCCSYGSTQHSLYGYLRAVSKYE